MFPLGYVAIYKTSAKELFLSVFSTFLPMSFLSPTIDQLIKLQAQTWNVPLLCVYDPGIFSSFFKLTNCTSYNFYFDLSKFHVHIKTMVKQRLRHNLWKNSFGIFILLALIIYTFLFSEENSVVEVSSATILTFSCPGTKFENTNLQLKNHVEAR